jgi:hypothetical protein
MRKKIKVRQQKSFKDTILYRFPTMSLKDTLIFVAVCIAAGFVFSGVLNIVFGAISILMIAHFVMYSVTSKYYATIEQSKKETTEKTVHTIKEV